LVAFGAKRRILEKTVRQSDWKLIRALPLFCEMSEANFATLVGAAFLQRFPLHTTLINEGDLPDFLHIVVEGSVEMFSAHNGHETTIEIMRPVTTFVLAAVIRDAVYLKSARTLTPAQILMIPAQTVRDVFDRDASFARAIVNELAERYRAVVRSLKNEKLPSARRVDLRQAHAGIALGDDAREPVAQPGAVGEIWRAKFRTGYSHRRFVGVEKLCQAQYAH